MSGATTSPVTVSYTLTPLGALGITPQTAYSNTVATWQPSRGIFGTTIYLRAVLASLERLSDALKALA